VIIAASDANGNPLTGLYTVQLEPAFPPYTDWVLRQAYGSRSYIWDVVGLCPNGGNGFTTAGYSRVAGTCKIFATPAVYGK